MILVLLMLAVSHVRGLRLSCGTRGASIDFVFPDRNTDYRELNCVCADNEGQSPDIIHYNNAYKTI